MIQLDQLKRGLQVRGLIPQQIVTLIDVEWHGASAVEVVFRRSDGQLGSQLLYQDHENGLEIIEAERSSPRIRTSASLPPV